MDSKLNLAQLFPIKYMQAHIPGRLLFNINTVFLLFTKDFVMRVVKSSLIVTHGFIIQTGCPEVYLKQHTPTYS